MSLDEVEPGSGRPIVPTRRVIKERTKTLARYAVGLLAQHGNVDTVAEELKLFREIV